MARLRSGFVSLPPKNDKGVKGTPFPFPLSRRPIVIVFCPLPPSPQFSYLHIFLLPLVRGKFPRQTKVAILGINALITVLNGILLPQ